MYLADRYSHKNDLSIFFHVFRSSLRTTSFRSAGLSSIGQPRGMWWQVADLLRFRRKTLLAGCQNLLRSRGGAEDSPQRGRRGRGITAEAQRAQRSPKEPLEQNRIASPERRSREAGGDFFGFRLRLSGEAILCALCASAVIPFVPFVLFVANHPLARFC